MDLTPTEEALLDLLRSIGSTPLHLGITSAGEGVSVTLVSTDGVHLAGRGATLSDALTNAYAVPEPEPQPQARERLQIVAGTDRQRAP